MIRPRSLARRAALQYCFMCDMNGDWENLSLADFLVECVEEAPAHPFAKQLVTQVLTQRAKIDAILTGCADNWSLGRIAAVERNILRVACAEMLAAKEPLPVIINEAVSLAKKFGAKDSARFVNGILDRASRSLHLVPAGTPPLALAEDADGDESDD